MSVLVEAELRKAQQAVLAERNERAHPGAEDASVGARPDVYTLSKLRTANLPTAEPIIEGVLSAGEVIAVVGKPKTGKSRLMQQLAVCASRGLSFLGIPLSQKYKVLYLDFENRPALVKARFIAMCKPSDDDKNLVVYVPQTLADNPFNLEDGFDQLKEFVRENGPDILIVDTWRLLLGRGDENKTDTIVPSLRRLSEIKAENKRMAIILVHHLRKQQSDTAPRLRKDPGAWVEGASGHYAFVAHVDAVLGLDREVDENGDELIVFGGVARGTLPLTLILEDDPETMMFTVANGAEIANKLFTSKEAEFWSAVGKLDVFTFTEALNISKTTNKKTVSSMLRRAESAGLLQKRGDGKYQRMTR